MNTLQEIIEKLELESENTALGNDLRVQLRLTAAGYMTVSALDRISEVLERIEKKLNDRSEAVFADERVVS